MSETDTSQAVPVRAPDDPSVETGHLPDDRQFVAAVQQVDGGWLALVHFFSSEGTYVDSEHAPLSQDGSEPPEEARAALEQMLRRLEPYREDAVTVGGFAAEIAGCHVGLAPAGEDGGLRLQPNGPTLPPAAVT